MKLGEAIRSAAQPRVAGLLLALAYVAYLVSLFSGQCRWDELWRWLPLVILSVTGAALLFGAKRRRVALFPPLWRMAALLALAALFNCVNLFVFEQASLLPVSILMSMAALALLWALLRRFACLFLVPFLLLEAAQVAGYEQYGSRINSLVLAETFESSLEEALAYLTTGNVLFLLAALLLLSSLAWLYQRVMRPVRRLSAAFFGVTAALASFLLSSVLPESSQKDYLYWPFQEFYNLYDACSEAIDANVATISTVEQLPSPTKKPSSLPLLPKDQGVVLLVHVGESVRADRMSLNGYGRDTTPWLRGNSRLINFPRCVSAACDTCKAEIAILSNARRSIDDPDPSLQGSCGSVLDLFAANGFSMYSFFGRRCAQKLKYDRVVLLLTHAAKKRFNASGSPWTAVPQMQAILQEHPQENLLFFINNEGSHTPFSHYDHENPPFAPAGDDFENPAAHAEEVNNAYDSSIHYTDDFVRRVCESLNGRPFVYLYISDHGEYLGHEGIWGRAGLGDSGRDYHSSAGCLVGMFLIASPEFERLNPQFAERLAELRRNSSLCVGQEHVFHTLLGLFGLQTPYYEAELDLSSPQAKPYSGPQPSR